MPAAAGGSSRVGGGGGKLSAYVVCGFLCEIPDTRTSETLTRHSSPRLLSLDNLLLYATVYRYTHDTVSIMRTSATGHGVIRQKCAWNRCGAACTAARGAGRVQSCTRACAKAKVVRLVNVSFVWTLRQACSQRSLGARVERLCGSSLVPLHLMRDSLPLLGRVTTASAPRTTRSSRSRGSGRRHRSRGT